MVRDADHQADLGAYYTPPKTVAHVLKVVGHDRIRAAQRVIEPAGGDGVFVEALIDVGLAPAAIEVWDIDADTEVSIEALGATWSLGDTLARDIADNTVDIVVGNPPYLNKRSSYIRENKGWLTKKFQDTGASEAYVMFTYAMVRSLRPGGRLGFVLSDTFLSLNSHQRFRDWLLNHTKIIELSPAPRNLFNAAVSTVILVVERCDSATERNDHVVRFYDRAASEEDYGSIANLHLVRQADIRLTPNHAFVPVDAALLDLFKSRPSLMKAGLDGQIGMHTKDNKRYLVAAASGIAGHAQLQAVDAGLLVPYLKTGGIQDYWAPISQFLLWDEPSRANYSIPRINHFGEPGVAISGISSRLSARVLEPGCYWDTNKVMGFQNHTGLTDATIVGLLNSTLYNHLAKRVLNTTSSLQIADLRRLPFLDLTSRQADDIHRLVTSIVVRKRSEVGNGAATMADARAQIDNIVFAAAGIDDALRAAIEDLDGPKPSRREPRAA